MNEISELMSTMVCKCEYEQTNSLEFWIENKLEKEWAEIFFELFSSDQKDFSIITDDIECITNDVPPTFHHFLESSLHLWTENKDKLLVNWFLERFEDKLEKFSKDVHESKFTIL